MKKWCDLEGTDCSFRVLTEQLFFFLPLSQRENLHEVFFEEMTTETLCMYYSRHMWGKINTWEYPTPIPYDLIDDF